MKQRPQGWYPDPDRPGQMRWWDGREWRAHAAAVGPDTGSTPDSYAVAAFVMALLFIPIVPIVLGVKARKRIDESNGTLDGTGLAIGAIVASIVETVAAVAIAVFAV